ncbi:MAG: triose-phosphate isomerase [Bacteroidota bacterium]|nr:triose-phosphate isomerase [Bacteroidota bacterium]MDX5427416.1 triose-phosphate isomerase [Bacteroidota bacterium]MDX5447464.1 triose-phosphate isomerase [Bacteroidota bacterium]MDX5505361.1 triose-phosphate isomerase [Bacteroidota bacterium]
MRKKIVAGNWKMNTTLGEGLNLLEDILEGISARPDLETQVVVAPPFTHLEAFVNKAWDSSDIAIVAQNCHQEENGAFTGEISAAMLASLNVDGVILGHSERRLYFGETDEILAQKVRIALENELVVIFCCGESLEEREANRHIEVVSQQLQKALFDLPEESWENIVIAYEPVWAIGTGRTASPEQAQEMHRAIRSYLAGQIGHLAMEVPILYGGSCKPDNAEEIFAQEDVDGGLIGGASLKANDFLSLIDHMEASL